MESMFLLSLLVAIGSLITSLTGLGGGTLILAGLLMIYPPDLAIPLHSFTQLTANGMRSSLHFKSVNWRVVASYGALMLPAAWLGALIFDFINPSFLKILVGLLIITSLLPYKWRPHTEPDNKTFMILGAFSGFLGVFVGAVGPMVLPFFNRLKLKRESMLATKSAGQMILQLSKIIAFSGAAGLNFVSLKEHVGFLVLGSIIGVGVSIPIGRKISDQKFNIVVNAMLVLISIKVIIEGVQELF